MKKMVANEKIDWLYSIIFFLLGLFLLFVCKVFDFYYEWTSFLGFMVVISSINVPTALRRKKQIQKIDELRKELNLSIEEGITAIKDGKTVLGFGFMDQEELGKRLTEEFIKKHGK